MLYFVPTPIGNLKDMTFRAIETLQEVDLILAEDTRRAGKLKQHFEIDTALKPFHAHNEHRALQNIVDRLNAGVQIAIITDAGTPGISDPGFLLARACRAEKIDVTCLPGATAFVPALVTSGISCDRFYFEGFLPPKKGRQTRLKYLATLDQSFVIYESPHKIKKTLGQLSEYMGPERAASLSREISKLNEEVINGTLQEIADTLNAKPSIKGEIVLVVAGNTP